MFSNSFFLDVHSCWQLYASDVEIIHISVHIDWHCLKYFSMQNEYNNKNQCLNKIWYYNNIRNQFIPLWMTSQRKFETIPFTNSIYIKKFMYFTPATWFGTTFWLALSPWARWFKAHIYTFTIKMVVWLCIVWSI